uniref:SH3b domain-containing protein n=1 Tax=Thermocrinis ruber TaxID=75906 RepID=A0A7C5X1N2_9AQUI
MLKRAAIILSGFALVGYTGGALAGYVISEGRDWLESAVIKLIEKYYELSQKVQELSQRVERLERQTRAEKREGEVREEVIKEKYQVREKLRVRACPRTSCGVVVVLERGEVVSLLSRKGNWAFIETADGVRGWVVSKYLQEYSY